MRLRPDYPDIYVDRGNSCHALGRDENALKDYSEAIRLKSNYAEAYANRAVVYAVQGDDEASSQDFDEATAHGIDPATLELLLEEAVKTRRK